MGTRTRIVGGVLAASLLAGGTLFVTLDDAPRAVAQPAAPAPTAPPVQVIEAIARSAPETASYTGRLAAVEQVELRPRVGGYIRAVRFREGSIVKRGQVLFELDPRPFSAAASRASAQLLQAQAQRTLAERQANRARKLRAEDVIAQAELDTATADEANSGAAVEAARAQLRAATIDLGDTRVRSPIDGRIGEANVTVGNLVSAGGPPLTTIVSIDKLHVEFDVDEATFRRLDRDAATLVQITIGDDDTRTAKLDFLGNHVDPSTGTARARAILPNPDGKLTPGLFARVRIETGAPRDVVLVRDEVIGTGAQGRFVLVVNADGVVEPRPVQLGETLDGLRIIKSGVKPGERVILKGMARPGMKVTPNVVPMTGGAS
jgi:gold/copper resistance efflux system membrane fusion protein